MPCLAIYLDNTNVLQSPVCLMKLRMFIIAILSIVLITIPNENSN